MTIPGNTLAGILLGIAGVASLSAMDATAKALGASLTTFQVGFVRYLGAAIWLVPFILVTRGAWPRRRNLRRHAMRAALIALTACLFFYGVINLPLAIATALAMSAPVYVSLLGVLVLKESFAPGLVLAVLLGLAGSMIIVFGGEPVTSAGASGWLPWAAAILAPVSYAAALVLLKHHSADESAASMTLAQSFLASLLFLPLALPGFAPLGPLPWLEIALVGFLGALGFVLLISGLRRIPASVFSVVDYTGLLWAAALGVIFFAERPGPELWIGGGLIIAACVVSTRAGRRTAATLSSAAREGEKPGSP